MKDIIGQIAQAWISDFEAGRKLEKQALKELRKQVKKDRQAARKQAREAKQMRGTELTI